MWPGEPVFEIDKICIKSTSKNEAYFLIFIITAYAVIGKPFAIVLIEICIIENAIKISVQKPIIS